MVAAIGGGSVIDLGKAVAMLLGNGGDPLDYLEVVGSGRKITKPAVPLVAVPSTAGTGAEVTANAVLASPSHRVKASLRSVLMIPRVALVDPLLTLTCPPPVTAASGLDALTQCLEPFVSVRANPLTDCLARGGLRRAAAGLRHAYADGMDVRGAQRHGPVQPAGRDGPCQREAWRGPRARQRRRRSRRRAARRRLRCPARTRGRGERARPAVRAAGRPSPCPVCRSRATADRRPGAAIEDGVAWIRETVTLLRIPGLREFGVRPQDFGDVAAKAMKASSTQGNPVVLTEDDLRAILAEAA